MNDRTKKMLPAILAGIAGVVQLAVALMTESQFSAILGVGLVIAAFSLWLQARKS